MKVANLQVTIHTGWPIPEADDRTQRGSGGMRVKAMYNGETQQMTIVNPDTGEELEGVEAVEFTWLRDHWGEQTGELRLTIRGTSLEVLNPPAVHVTTGASLRKHILE